MLPVPDIRSPLTNEQLFTLKEYLKVLSAYVQQLEKRIEVLETP